MQRSAASLLRTHRSRGLSSSTSSDGLVAAVLFERLPVVIPKIDPLVYAFQEFSFQWRQQFRRKYPDEVLGKGDARGKGDYQIDYVPAPRITEADKANDRKSLQRALDRRLYLLLNSSTYEAPGDEPVCTFLKKFMRVKRPCERICNSFYLELCAESVLKSILGGLDHTYFVGNAPMAHMTVKPTESSPSTPAFKRFFFKSQVIGASKLSIGKCKDYVWVTKDELMEYFPEDAEFFNQMIIS